MSFKICPLILVLGGSLFVSLCADTRGGDVSPGVAPVCGRSGEKDAFETEVWDNVGAVRCRQCHQEGGGAGESALILLDPRNGAGRARAAPTRRHA